MYNKLKLSYLLHCRTRKTLQNAMKTETLQCFAVYAHVFQAGTFAGAFDR
jgi:hypothetical protein